MRRLLSIPFAADDNLFVFRRSQEIISSTAEYGVIPHEDWFQPDWIDEVKAQKAREKMIEQKVRIMCSHIKRYEL